MADKITIDIFRLKTAEQLSKAFAEKESKLEVGSAAASAASHASAIAARAAALALEEQGENERLAYIERNLGIIRNYMVFLIDEDVKSRGPLKRAYKEGGQMEIDACIQPASCISAEIINMMGQCLDFLAELCELCPKKLLHYLGEAAELAMGAIRSARIYILDLAARSSDETYVFVTRRENEITLENCTKTYNMIIEKVMEALS